MNPAFAYVYDTLLSDPKWERVIAQLENALAHSGIEGRIARLAMFRSPREMIQDMLRGGAKTIVFVGNDQTVLSHMSFLPSLDATFGFISVDPSSTLAPVLDVPIGVEAAEVLAARFVEPCDVGQCGDRFFLMDVQIPGGVYSLEIDQSFRVQTDTSSRGVIIENVGCSSPQTADHAKRLCADGFLDIEIRTQPVERGMFRFVRQTHVEQSRLHAKQIRVRAEQPFTYRVDQQLCEGSEMTVSIWPSRMRWITRRRHEGLRNET